MALEVVTSFGTLMRYAAAVGKAKKSGDPEAIAKAEAEHDAYRDACLKSDKMSLGMTHGDLAGIMAGKHAPRHV